MPVNVKLRDARLETATAVMPPPTELEPKPDGDDGLYCPSEVQILVIDDEEPVCILVERTLNWPNFRVDTISQPDKIEAQLQARKYHLIILDYNIPGLKTETL